MLAKLTAKNQITIPKDVISRLPNVEYFDVSYEDGRVILKPLKVYDTDLEGIRSKMKQLGISENSVGEAVKWAREK
jgi:bifunctional DNA-binding transcriptional regulator/antitoxin component of YhaV-PrlF toxin-antitoxin module